MHAAPPCSRVAARIEDANLRRGLAVARTCLLTPRRDMATCSVSLAALPIDVAAPPSNDSRQSCVAAAGLGVAATRRRVLAVAPGVHSAPRYVPATPCRVHGPPRCVLENRPSVVSAPLCLVAALRGQEAALNCQPAIFVRHQEISQCTRGAGPTTRQPALPGRQQELQGSIARLPARRPKFPTCRRELPGVDAPLPPGNAALQPAISAMHPRRPSANKIRRKDNKLAGIANKQSAAAWTPRSVANTMRGGEGWIHRGPARHFEECRQEHHQDHRTRRRRGRGIVTQCSQLKRTYP
jgi:hypothetical protein